MAKKPGDKPVKHGKVSGNKTPAEGVPIIEDVNQSSKNTEANIDFRFSKIRRSRVAEGAGVGHKVVAIAFSGFSSEEEPKKPDEEDVYWAFWENVPDYEGSKQSWLLEPSDFEKIPSVESVPDKYISVNLRDLAALAFQFDRTEPGSLEKFCHEVEALDQAARKSKHKAAKRLSSTAPRLSQQEAVLVEEIKSQELPNWADRKKRNDDLRQLPAPIYFAIVYGEWMGPTLTRQVLNAVDPDLVDGLSNWQTNNSSQLPPGIVLPNQLSESQKWVARVTAGEPVAVEADTAALVRNASRLRRLEKKNR